MDIEGFLNPFIWMFFWIVLTPISIYRLWKELRKPKDQNINGIIESSFVLLVSIIYIVIKYFTSFVDGGLQKQWLVSKIII